MSVQPNSGTFVNTYNRFAVLQNLHVDDNEHQQNVHTVGQNILHIYQQTSLQSSEREFQSLTKLSNGVDTTVKSSNLSSSTVGHEKSIYPQHVDT